MSQDKRKALGRGLSALLPPAPAPSPAGGAPAPAPPASPPSPRRDFFVCGIEEVHPSGENPRKDFDEEALAELSESIREHGLLQPLLVRQRDGGDGFTLVAGERRWKAAQRAGLKEVPVVVKEASDAHAFELALVENLQRRDLNAIEEAEAYRRLSDDYGHTHEQIARRVGKDRATVANSMRLLKLPDAVRAMVIDGRLQMGHARALLGLDGAQAIAGAAEQVVKAGLSVRQTEALVRKLREPPKEPKKAPEKSPNIRDLEHRLQRSVGVPCRVVEKGENTGKLEIEYANLDELDRVLDKLLRP